MATDVMWPLTFNHIRRGLINHTFGMVRNGGKKAHQGWDFEAAEGTPTYAIGDGEVVFTSNNGDYGKQLCVSFTQGGKTYYAFYAHLKHLYVTSGTVSRGQAVAQTGTTGNAKGQPAADHHLHFEIRTKPYCGKGLAGRVSPLTIFGFCPLNTTIAQV